ncbi:hypothetical protein M9458_051298 [Cirrhinus mrigala]|uniref:Uncharacterized protein n=1 Tax=Cirrhinus mrigala TaxID=683832 RepID=A0ABD0MTM5_CIRMR
MEDPMFAEGYQLGISTRIQEGMTLQAEHEPAIYLMLPNTRGDKGFNRRSCKVTKLNAERPTNKQQLKSAAVKAKHHK